MNKHTIEIAELKLLMRLYEASRSMKRYHGVDKERFNKGMLAIYDTVEELNHYYATQDLNDAEEGIAY